MNKTKIEWCRNPDGTPGYTWNPITGCLNHVNGMCKGGNFPCYAYKIANGRVKNVYLANHDGIPIDDFAKFKEAMQAPFYPRFWPERLFQAWDIKGRQKSKGVFVCDMSDLFGIGIPEKWTGDVLDIIRFNKSHRFYLLTKQPQNLAKFSPFSENAWVGVTATDHNMLQTATGHLRHIKAAIKYISLEPLLHWQQQHDKWLIEDWQAAGINWLIIGACTGTKQAMEEFIKRYPSLALMPFHNKWTAQPKIEWVREIVQATDKAGIPVFLKDSLLPLIGRIGNSTPELTTIRENSPDSYSVVLRQEMPS